MCQAGRTLIFDRALGRLSTRVEATAGLHESAGMRALHWNTYDIPLLYYPSQAALPSPPR